MPSPTAIVIDEDKEFLEKVSTTLPDHPLNFQVRAFKSYEQYLQFQGVSHQTPHLFLIGYKGRGENNLHIAEEINRSCHLAAKVMVIDKGVEDKDKIEILTKLKDKEIVDDLIEKPANLNELPEIILPLMQNLVTRAALVQPISLGVVGLGRFGMSVLQNAERYLINHKGLSLINKLYAYSSYVQEKQDATPDDIRRLAGLAQDVLVMPNSLDELAAAKPDILVIATGIYHKKVDFEGLEKRNGALIEHLFDKNLPKINKVFDAMRKHQFPNITVIETSPSSPFLRLAAYHCHSRNGSLTSISADNLRARYFISQDLKKRQNKDYHEIKPEDISITVIGEHESPIPLLDTCTIQNKKIQEVLETSDEEFRQYGLTLRKRLIDEGLKTMQSAERVEAPYTDTPTAFLSFIQSYARFEDHTSQALYCSQTFEEKDFFWMLPARIVHRYSAILPDKYFSIDKLGEDIARVLRKQRKHQDELTLAGLEKILKSF